MAQRKTLQSNAFGSTQFAAIKLEEKDKTTFKSWFADAAGDMDDYMKVALVGGWKTSASYDSNNDCFIVSFTQRNEKDVNSDICVTSRSDNLWEAYGLGIYKIYIMFKDAKIPTEAKKDNWG